MESMALISPLAVSVEAVIGLGLYGYAFRKKVFSPAIWQMLLLLLIGAFIYNLYGFLTRTDFQRFTWKTGMYHGLTFLMLLTYLVMIALYCVKTLDTGIRDFYTTKLRATAQDVITVVMYSFLIMHLAMVGYGLQKLYELSHFAKTTISKKS